MVQAETLPNGLVEKLRRTPIHAVLADLCQAAIDAKVDGTPEFKKLFSNLLELADGRDRREPWTTLPGNARPVPKLRILIDKCFGVYGDIHWFTLNKTTNNSGQPLIGLFPRIAASMWRLSEADLANVLRALLSPVPDAALLRLLHEQGGKIQGLSVDLLSRLAFALRRDLFFVIPREWGQSSGCIKYIGEDLRKYCGVCRNLRAVCDELGVPSPIRGSVFLNMLDHPQPPSVWLKALHKAVGPSLARYSALDSNDAYELSDDTNDQIAMPMEFATKAIRSRRGRRDLRSKLVRACGERCAILGACLKDLLEVAYVVPYPDGDVHAMSNCLLLRSDLHTLWDLNLLGIEPKTLKVYIASRLSGTSYERLAGRTIVPRASGTGISDAGLKERWRMFVNAHPTALTPDSERDTMPSKRGKKATRGGSAVGLEVESRITTTPRLENDAAVEA